MVTFHKQWKKYYEIHITKNRMHLNNNRNKHNMLVHYKRWKTYKEKELTKN